MLCRVLLALARHEMLRWRWMRLVESRGLILALLMGRRSLGLEQHGWNYWALVMEGRHRISAERSGGSGGIWNSRLCRLVVSLIQ